MAVSHLDHLPKIRPGVGFTVGIVAVGYLFNAVLT